MKKSYKHILLLSCIALAFASCKQEEPSKPNNSGGNDTPPSESSMPSEIGSAEINDGYELVWEDTFNEDVLDESYWNIEVNGNGGGNAELQFYRKENVSIEEEPETGRRCLVLTARKEEYAGKKVTSGRINSMGKIFYTHGKIEALIRMPKTYKGLWPAFWMMGNDYKTAKWPSCGEIDILEAGNSGGHSSRDKSEKFFNGACHWGFYKEGNYPNYGKSVTNSYSVQDGFHLFTCIWDENSVRMFVDYDQDPTKQPYYQMGIKNDGSKDDWAAYKYFHKDFFILFNLAVGGKFPGIYDINQVSALNEENGYEAKMYVDYVKVYQK